MAFQDWVNMQKRTFTRYINSKLASRGLIVDDLYEDVKDGRILYHFLEALTGASLKKYGRLNTGGMKIQQVANMNVVFAFLPDADVKISNIGVLDIVEGRPKSVLGLIWSIIAFYLVRDVGGAGERDVAAVKRRVLKWAKKRSKRVPVTDLTKSFADGRAFLAILHDVDASGSPYEPSNDPSENFERAFADAHAKYGLPRMLEASTDCWRDEISMLTYLASMMETLPGRVEQPDGGLQSDAWLVQRTDEVGECLATLCACASTSRDAAGRSACLAILKAAAQRAGLAETRLGTGSRVFASKIDATKPTLLYHASTHVATPDTDAWRRAADALPFADAQLVKGRVCAAGARRKGMPLAPFLACEAVRDEAASLNVVIVVGSGDADADARDVRALGVEADYALVSDLALSCAAPGAPTLVFGCRGNARLRVSKEDAGALAGALASLDVGFLPSLSVEQRGGAPPHDRVGLLKAQLSPNDATAASLIVEQLATVDGEARASLRVLTPPAYDDAAGLTRGLAAQLGATVAGSLRPGYLTDAAQPFADVVERAQTKSYDVKAHSRVLSPAYAPVACALAETLPRCAVFQAGRAPSYVDKYGRPGESVSVQDVLDEAKVLARVLGCAASDLVPPAPRPAPFAAEAAEPASPTTHFDGRQLESPRQRRKLPAGRVWPPPSPPARAPSPPARAPVPDKPGTPRGDTPPPPAAGHGPASPPASPGPSAPPSPSDPPSPLPDAPEPPPAKPRSAPAADPAPAAHRGAFAGWFVPRPAPPRADSLGSLEDLLVSPGTGEDVPTPVPDTAGRRSRASLADAAFLVDAAPVPGQESPAPPPRHATKVLFTSVVPAPEEPARMPLVEIVGRDPHDSLAGHVPLKAVSRESTPRSADTDNDAPTPGLDAPMRATAERLISECPTDDAESWETGSTHHEDAKSTASDESWATEDEKAARLAKPRKRATGHVCPTTRPPPRASPRSKAPTRPTAPLECPATRPIISPPPPAAPVARAPPPARACLTARHPPRASPAKPRAFSPSTPHVPPAPPDIPRSPPQTPTSPSAARFFQGDPLRDSPPQGAPMPALATPAEVVEEINRVRRDPAAYAAFLRATIAPRYRLDGSYWPREASARPHRTHEGLPACEGAIAELDALGADCLPPLKVFEGMHRAAADHVGDLVRTERLGHTGSDGSAPAQRLNRHGRWFERASECLAHGRRTAVGIVA